MQFVSLQVDLPSCSARQQVAEPGSYSSTEPGSVEKLVDWRQRTGPLVIAAAAQAVPVRRRAAFLH